MRRFLRSVSPGSQVWVILLVAVVAALVAAPGAGAGGQAGYGCPPGFDVGGVNLQQFLALPRHQAGLAAGAFGEDFLLSVFSKVDHNGDGVVCAKDVAALNGGVSFWQYVYNLADDNASPAAG
jgi:hypothetical protein